jgi:hypothetical protein
MFSDFLIAFALIPAGNDVPKLTVSSNRPTSVHGSVCLQPSWCCIVYVIISKLMFDYGNRRCESILKKKSRVLGRRPDPMMEVGHIKKEKITGPRFTPRRQEHHVLWKRVYSWLPVAETILLFSCSSADSLSQSRWHKSGLILTSRQSGLLSACINI